MTVATENESIFFSKRPRNYSTSQGMIKELEDSDPFFLMRRKIDLAYVNLPWPSTINHVVVYTKVIGGKGDVSAAAKVVSLVQRLHSTAMIDWVLEGASQDLIQEAPSFISHIATPLNAIRALEKPLLSPLSKTPIDFIISGPCDAAGVKNIARKLQRPLSQCLGVRFLEIGSRPHTFHFHESAIQEDREDSSPLFSLYKQLFPSNDAFGGDALVMGLYLGSGLFFDQKLIQAPLSQVYSCPSYLENISDRSLRRDIFCALSTQQKRSSNCVRGSSFNFGYAHMLCSWRSFIDCIAFHEREKNVVVVLNQKEISLDTIHSILFANRIFTEKRKAIYQELGFGLLQVCDESGFLAVYGDSEGEGRIFTIILRKSFLPQDVHCMQLAADRILATGDNSAAEALACRCKLFLYETLTHKMAFLQQLIDLAASMGLTQLARLWALFSGDYRVEETKSRQTHELTLGPLEIDEIQTLLRDVSLCSATYSFCLAASSCFDFEIRLQGYIMRSLWHHTKPLLKKIEYDFLGEGFMHKIHTFITQNELQTLSLLKKDLSPLIKKVHHIALDLK